MATIMIFDDNGNELTVPAKFIVCENCEGEGTVSVMGAMTTSEMAEILHDDPDFYGDYMAGHYDEKCPDCQGKRVQLVGDEDKMTPEQLAIFLSYEESQAIARAEEANERRYFGL